MSDAVITQADPSTATSPEAPPQAPVAANDAPQSFAEQQKSWTREQRDRWKLTGQEPEPASAAAPAEKSETQEPSVPNKGKTEAVTEPAEDDQDLPEGDTAEARRTRNQTFARLRRERAEFKAKYELLAQQAKDKPAVITESVPDPKPAPKDDKPTKFKFREPTDTETMQQYLDARDEAYADFVTELTEKRIFGKLEQRKAEETRQERDTRIQNEYRERATAALKQREGESEADNRVRRLQYANASQWFTDQTEKAGAEFIDDAILESPVGHELMLYYHGKPDEFASLLKSSPTRALALLGKVEATFEGKKPPELKPVTRSSTPDPGPRVDSSSTAHADPLKEAYDQFDKTGDQKYLRIAMKLENERATAKLQRK